MIDRKKLGKKNKAKGSAYERKVAREISKRTGERWVRTPMSGAWHIPGDICNLDNPYEYTIECKNRQDLSLLKVFKNPEVLKPWAEDKQIIIFNDSGTSIVVAPVEFIEKDYDFCYGTCVIQKKVYYIMILKEFCKLLNKEIR